MDFCSAQWFGKNVALFLLTNIVKRGKLAWAGLKKSGMETNRGIGKFLPHFFSSIVWCSHVWRGERRVKSFWCELFSLFFEKLFRALQMTKVWQIWRIKCWILFGMNWKPLNAFSVEKLSFRSFFAVKLWTDFQKFSKAFCV